MVPSSGFAVMSSALWMGGCSVLAEEQGLLPQRRVLTRSGTEFKKTNGGLMKSTRCTPLGTSVSRKKYHFLVSASNSRSAEPKARDSKDASRYRSQSGDEDSQRQSKPKTAAKTLADAAQQKKIIKDGFAGLSAFKTQLEQERPRISKANAGQVNNAASLQNQQREGRITKTAVHSELSSAPDKGAPVQRRSNSFDSTRTRSSGRLREENAKSRRIRDGNDNSRARGETSDSGLSWSKKSFKRLTETDGTAGDSSEFHRSHLDDGDKFKDEQARVKHSDTTIASTLPITPPFENTATKVKFPDSGSDSDSPDYGSGDDGKLTGKSVMEAFERAAAFRDSKSISTRRKGKLDSDSYIEQKTDPLPPFVFKTEWASQIQELEKALENLRRVP